MTPAVDPPSFAVIIPMYNEEAGAERCVRAVTEKLPGLPGRSVLIVIDDGSRDQTGAILTGLAEKFRNLRVITHPQNRGYGAAIRSGIRAALEEDFRYALFMDSDLTNDPADIAKFVQKMREGIDVIKASRYVPGGRMQGVPWRRTAVSRLGNLLARGLFGLGVRDCTNGFRAVSLQVLARTNLHESGFAIIMEELYQCKYLARTFQEIPVVLTNRNADQRGTSFSYRPALLMRYLSYGLKAFLGIKPALKQEHSS
jgi:dolichol-phosphate mannosyltransferase